MNPTDLKRLDHPFLAGLKSEYLALLSTTAMPISFPENHWVFHERDIANRFYLLIEGRVAVVAENYLGESMKIQTLGAGDVLGWSWMTSEERWTFSARTEEPCRAVFLYATQVRDLCESIPQFGYEILSRVSQVLVGRLHTTRHLLVAERRRQHSLSS